MSPARRYFLILSRLMLGLLVLFIGAVGARQEALGARVSAKHTTIHKSVAQRVTQASPKGSSSGKHPAAAHHKKHRTRAHRPAVAKIAVLYRYELRCIETDYPAEQTVSRMALFPYGFFGEITPPPPKDC